MEQLSCEKAYLSILCVEDDPGVRNLLSDTIKKRFPNFTVHLAENGVKGLDKFKEHAPQLTITDLCMPMMDGLRMAKEIRKLEPDAPILVMTAYVDTSYLLEAIRLGISDYLLKPVAPDLLCKAINDIVTRFPPKRETLEERGVVNAPSANGDIAAYCYRLAHDLRSPLNGINVTSEALIMLFGDQLNDECKTFIGYIKEEVLRMNRMIDGILELSRGCR